MEKSAENLFDKRATMRDGVSLSVDLYGISKVPKPTILFRTPYGKESDIKTPATFFSSRGYVFASADVRGRGDSDGVFVPYENEGRDGFDTIGWIRKQPWSNGSVATWGASYCGRIQWYTAELQPEGLKAMVPVVSPSDPFVEDPTGMPSPLSISWDYLVSGRSLQNTDLVEWDSIYKHLPLSDMDTLVGKELPHWKARLQHRLLDDFNRKISYQSAYENVRIPVLNVSGWYDDEQIGTPLNFQKMRGLPDRKISAWHSLLMGPWGHQVNKSSTLGEFDFGPDAMIDLLDYETRWLDHHLKGSGPMEYQDKVRLFIMGSNKWKTFESWPPENSSRISLYISSKGSANSRFGDGSLNFVQPQYDSNQDAFNYDPENPVPFIADQNYAQIGGPDDYSAIERRDDVLVYSTGPLDRDLEIVGGVTASLYVSTSARDTDFTAKLLVVRKDSKAIRLCDGITRMSRREGHDREVETEPGRVYKIEIDMWNTAFHFPPGSSIRLEISSSAFPKYARNLNVFGDQSAVSDLIRADQMVYHGKKYPSELHLYAMNA